MPPGGSNRLLGIPEAADYLGVPKRTLAQKWRDWGLTGHKIGKLIKFRERELERFIDSRAEVHPPRA